MHGSCSDWLLGISAFVRHFAYDKSTLTIGFVSSVGEYFLIAAANKPIRNIVMTIEREDVVDVMALEFISELRHSRSVLC